MHCRAPIQVDHYDCIVSLNKGDRNSGIGDSPHSVIFSESHLGFLSQAESPIYSVGNTPIIICQESKNPANPSLVDGAPRLNNRFEEFRY